MRAGPDGVARPPAVRARRGAMPDGAGVVLWHCWADCCCHPTQRCAEPGRAKCAGGVSLGGIHGSLSVGPGGIERWPQTATCKNNSRGAIQLPRRCASRQAARDNDQWPPGQPSLVEMMMRACLPRAMERARHTMRDRLGRTKASTSVTPATATRLLLRRPVPATKEVCLQQAAPSFLPPRRRPPGAVHEATPEPDAQHPRLLVLPYCLEIV